MLKDTLGVNTRDIYIVFGVDERDIVLLHANVVLAAFYKFHNTVFAQLSVAQNPVKKACKRGIRASGDMTGTTPRIR